MDDDTRRALLEHDRRFYREHAAEFDAKRERPWPGFSRAFAALPASGPLRVLDLGCGNARLAGFLYARVGERLDYLGVDHSEPLLQRASQRVPEPARTHVRLVATELVDVKGCAQVPAGDFELVTLLGVLHHIPGEATRRALIHAALSRLAPGGRLVLTVWRFLEEPRLRARVLGFDDAGCRALLPRLDESQLEPGDLLLRWGDGDASARYCHAASDEEVSRWLVGLPAPRDRFFSDGSHGALNEYLVLARS